MRQLLRIYLVKAGYQVIEASSGMECMQRIRSDICHLVILDVMMPGMDGIGTCKQIRQQTRDLPILLLTAKETTEQKVIGLTAGADDYLIKPFDSRELVARVESLLRRAYPGNVSQIELPSLQLRLDANGKIATIAGKDLLLTGKEFEILLLLARRPGRTFAREEILEMAWGMEYEGETRTVDTHIKNLREKLRLAGSPIDPVITVWGIGYKFQVPV